MKERNEIVKMSRLKTPNRTVVEAVGPKEQRPAWQGDQDPQPIGKNGVAPRCNEQGECKRDAQGNHVGAQQCPSQGELTIAIATTDQPGRQRNHRRRIEHRPGNG
jgi:hypothetical protein